MSDSVADAEQTTSDLIRLARWMSGGFSNAKQVASDPVNFAHIRVYFQPLPFDFFGAIGLYSEQVYDYDLWRPYRQGIHRLVDCQDHIYIENYGLKDGVLFAGSGRDKSLLDSLSHTDIVRRERCSMVFKREGSLFRGGVEPGNGCLISKQGHQTYLVSEVEITENTWVSRDRGFDVETHEHIWGSEHGPLRFEKQENYADQVPA
ncbi:MAG: chromophore lyase CpcT/CpeT [Cyanobacteria bacterium P01_H01_bin.15]